MVKFFKIIEKIVWIIAALTIAAVLAMVFIGAFANLDKAQFDWSSYIPYFYGAAAVVVLYKIVVLYYTSFYQTEIDEKIGILVSLDDEMKKFRANSQEGSLPDAKFDAIMEAVKQVPQTDTNAATQPPISRVPTCAWSTAWCTYGANGSGRWARTARLRHGSSARYGNSTTSSMNAIRPEWTSMPARLNGRKSPVAKTEHVHPLGAV